MIDDGPKLWWLSVEIYSWLYIRKITTAAIAKNENANRFVMFLFLEEAMVD